MVRLADQPAPSTPRYFGLRMSADEYLALPDDGFRYELLNGVVVMSPSPFALHQRVLVHLTDQFLAFLKAHPLGEVLPDMDVRLAPDLVYRPDLIFVRRERAPGPLEHVDGPPDLVVEIVSPASGPLDERTKRRDYQRFGVREYWMLDPQARRAVVFRLSRGRYLRSVPRGRRVECGVLPGFALDLESLWTAAGL